MSSTEIRVERLDARALAIPFVTAFRHAAAERRESSTVWVEASDGLLTGFGEGCPRPYVTGESVDSALAFVREMAPAVCRDVTSLETLRAWVALHSAIVDAHPAAWCAIELAIVDLLGRRAQLSVDRLLESRPLAPTFRYTAVLGDAEPAAFRTLARRYQAQGFRDFKVKLSGDITRDRAKLEVFRGDGFEAPSVRADANNLWPSAQAAIDGLSALAFPFFAVEEPIGPPGRYGALGDIADVAGTRIILDESLLRRDQMASLDGPPERWLINVRVSKMGGLLRSLEVVREAIGRGIGVIVGAQVGETSLLTRAALTVATATNAALVAHEGGFGTHLLSRDVIDPPLMFGAAGILSTADFQWLQSPGLGSGGNWLA